MANKFQKIQTKKKKKTPTPSTRTAHLISFSPFHWLIIFIHSFLSFLIYSNFLARFPHSFPQLPVFCCQKNGPGGVSPEHFWFRWNPTTTNSPYRATHQVAFPCLADRWHLTSQTFFCELKDQNSERNNEINNETEHEHGETPRMIK